MLQNHVILELSEKYKPIWALNHFSSVASWDLETYMPQEGAAPRGFATSQVALVRQKFVLGMKELIERAENERDLNDQEKGVVRLLRRSLDYFTKVPPELVEQIQKVRTEATVVWRQARKKSQFSLFEPHLKKLVELKRQEAEKLGYEKHPYDALLDQREEGLTVEDLDSIFAKLIPGLKEILRKVKSDKIFPSRHPLESVKYDLEAMEGVNEAVLKILDMPMTRFRMDVSTHPFTSAFDLNDVRITTRYEGVDFRASMYSTMHECGHAIYGLQVGSDLEYTPIGTGASSGIHESQSRFIENVIGRSKEFARVFAPTIKANLKFVSKYNATDLFYYFNLVRPSLIRVDADELTYNFHIAIRYNIEKKLFSEGISVSDLPSIWGDTFDDYLGIRPKKDSDGVLQDIHWSSAGFAGFPGYTIGNVVDGMIWNKVREELDLGKLIVARNIQRIKKWLGDKIHKWGATYAPKELLRRTFGESYNPEWLLKYLEKKYTNA
jgi:carboxypeptidase Taq